MPVFRLFLIQNIADGLHVFLRAALIGFPLLRRLLGDRLIKNGQLKAGRQRRHVGAATTFIMIGQIERHRRRVADGQEAVIAHHHHHPVAETRRQPFGLVTKAHAIEPAVDGDPVVEPGRRLIDRGQDR